MEIRPAATPLFAGLDWKQRPVLYAYQAPGAVKKGARVLLTAGKEPLLVTWKAGGGQAAVLLGPPLGHAAGTCAYWDWKDWPRLMADLLKSPWE